MGHARMQGPLRLAPDLEASLVHCDAALDSASRVALASATPAVQQECMQAIESARPQQRTTPAFIQGVIHGVTSTLTRSKPPRRHDLYLRHVLSDLTIPESSKRIVTTNCRVRAALVFLADMRNLWGL